MKSIPEDWEDIRVLDELVKAQLNVILEKLAQQHSIEEVEADAGFLSDIIGMFKAKDALTVELINSASTARGEILDNLKRQGEFVRQNKEKLNRLVARSSAAAKRSDVLIAKMNDLLNITSENGSIESGNLILSKLPIRGYRHLFSNLSRVSLAQGESLCEPGQELRYVYFPETAVLSVLSLMEDGSMNEIALVGSEGMLGSFTFSSLVKSPFRILTQGAGTAMRIEADIFEEEVRLGTRLQNRVLRYMQIALTESRQAIACAQHHTVEQKLARWLLTMHDRQNGRELTLTHEMISAMIGIRRASVSVAAKDLQQQGLIDYRRGHILITDRPRLEAVACECYQIIKAAYNGHLRA